MTDRKMRDEVLDELMEQDWAIGFNDRGLGHGDYAVILTDKESEVVVKCPSREVAEHILAGHKLAQAHVGLEHCAAIEKLFEKEEEEE